MIDSDTEKNLHTLIIEKALVRGENTRIVGANNAQESWLFDFRAILFEQAFLESYTQLFWEKYASFYPFQVGGIETAAISLVTALVQSGAHRGTPINGFYIRKSRKPQGLQKQIEGAVSDLPVILVDDLINSGGSFMRQISVLAEHPLLPKVVAIFAVVGFRDVADYTALTDRNIKILYVFNLSDFKLTFNAPKKLPLYDTFISEWKIAAPQPEFLYRLPKSGPVIDVAKLYFGSDNGTLWAVDQETGKEVWHYKILGLGAQGKTIFCSPVLLGNMLYFGAYDGNFYALNTETGKELWSYMDADWIGSSPCVAEDLGLVYVGLEYGLFKKRGGIVALDAKTGKKKWEYISMPEFTHSSPAYSKKFNAVVIGSNDGVCYCFDAKTGELRWKLQTGGEIKMSFAFDESRGYVVFGSFDGNIYIARISDGSVVSTYKTNTGIFSTPLVHNDKVYVASLDKHIYCVNLDTFKLEWKYLTSGRIFASPAIADGMLYIGSNDGCLYEIDPTTGMCSAIFQTTERITNKIAYNEKTRRFYVPTYANEIYCLKKKK